MPRPTVDEVASNLRGPKEDFIRTLQDKDALLANVCRYAEYVAKKKKCEPWSIIGQIMGHGSGVSSAIYELYRDYED